MFRTFAFATLLTALPLWAQEPSPVAQQEYGVICAIDTNGQQSAPDTESGVINLIDQTRALDVVTYQVPAELGLSFGTRVLVTNGTSIGDARMSVTHPPMGPRGITHQSWNAPLHGGVTALNMFTFEDQRELVLGTWIFQLTHAEKVLSEQVFQVLPGGSVPAVQKTCGGVQLTS